MDSIPESQLAVVMGIWVLIQALIADQNDFLAPSVVQDEEMYFAPTRSISDTLAEPMADPFAHMDIGLHLFRLYTSSFVMSEELGLWVKPRSTTWFNRFLMEEYDDSCWFEMFRMRKSTVFGLADLLAPQIHRKDTKYRVVVPVIIRIACTLFKLIHGVSLFVCSEMFAIGKSTVCGVLRDVVHAINKSLRYNIRWPTGNQLRVTHEKFANLCKLPSVVGAIDGTHVEISKPRHIPADYYYFKSGGYTINCQAVVDSDKRFLDLYLGMPGSTNDSRVLRRSTLYDLATNGTLFSNEVGGEGFTPYLIGDLGYPLLPWLMVPHRSNVRLLMAQALFNKKLRKGRCVVENAFGILKQSFRELLDKCDLDVTFVPDVILCCCILHNVLLGQCREDVQSLFNVLESEGVQWDVIDNSSIDGNVPNFEGGDAVRETAGTAAALQKQQLLGTHLSNQRPNLP